VEEKRNGIFIAKDFIKENNLAKNTKIARIVEGAEDSIFKAYFEGFYEAIDIDYRQFTDHGDRKRAELSVDKLIQRQE
jgi:hypothetical protein